MLYCCPKCLLQRPTARNFQNEKRVLAERSALFNTREGSCTPKKVISLKKLHYFSYEYDVSWDGGTPYCHCTLFSQNVPADLQGSIRPWNTSCLYIYVDTLGKGGRHQDQPQVAISASPKWKNFFRRMHRAVREFSRNLFAFPIGAWWRLCGGYTSSPVRMSSWQSRCGRSRRWWLRGRSSVLRGEEPWAEVGWMESGNFAYSCHWHIPTCNEVVGH